MVGSSNHLKIIKTELGDKTGEVLLQTEDGRWWEEWDGITKTGEEVTNKN